MLQDNPTPPDPPLPPPADPPAEEPGKFRDAISVAVACVALTGFGVFALALLFMLDLEEVNWTRALYLLNGVEAIAFAAAGYLFGREVNRGRAETAETMAKEQTQRANRAEVKEQQAEENAKDLAARSRQAEEKGQQLADTIRVTASASRSREDVLTETAESSERGFPYLEALADALFPPRGLGTR